MIKRKPHQIIRKVERYNAAIRCNYLSSSEKIIDKGIGSMIDHNGGQGGIY